MNGVIDGSDVDINRSEDGNIVSDTPEVLFVSDDTVLNHTSISECKAWLTPVNFNIPPTGHISSNVDRMVLYVQNQDKHRPMEGVMHFMIVITVLDAVLTVRRGRVDARDLGRDHIRVPGLVHDDMKTTVASPLTGVRDMACLIICTPTPSRGSVAPCLFMESLLRRDGNLSTHTHLSQNACIFPFRW
ncbi:hypothetical protein AYL99_11605 [Fonsecaea erecta]|uniref:Uncharacterized protein n=1 Tax=Fonsecaea erecta TaxID=1367422 RepID=A0A178Z3H2_9EURO|nr:hypothetical protein AYL99_11605 [Fonsecaea erecta]OAP54071.1 hypothetical protein AYL99_11605 [Fonsecaea erecta]